MPGRSSWSRSRREEEKRRAEYHLGLLNLWWAVLLAVPVAVVGAALANTALSVVGALVALLAVAAGLALRRQHRSGR